jgi:hypothetical protein
MNSMLSPSERQFALKNLVGLAKHEIWMTLGRHPLLLNAFKLIENKSNGLSVVAANTDFVIESYPRSANTFAWVAFQMAQSRIVKVAHHVHGPAQVIRASRFGIPCMVIIRDPLQAVASLLVRYPYLIPSISFRHYYLFHHTLESYLADIYIATFEEVVSDFGEVTRQLNKRFGTRFGVFEHNQENIKRCYDRIDELDKLDRGLSSTDPRSVARPTEDQEKFNVAKALGDLENCAYKQKAQGIYESFRLKAQSQT